MSFLSQPLQDVIFGPSRMIGSIAVQVVVDEATTDTLTITKQPVQQGASITDHAYMEPTVLSMTIYFSGNSTLSFLPTPLSTIYQQLLTLQSSRVPITVTTPKRTYFKMLIASLSQLTDKNTENCLKISVAFQQIIIVSVSTVQVPRVNQKTPAKTGATQPAGVKPSVLNKLDGGLTFSQRLDQLAPHGFL